MRDFLIYSQSIFFIGGRKTKSKEVLALDGVFVLLSAVNFMGYCRNQEKKNRPLSFYFIYFLILCLMKSASVITCLGLCQSSNFAEMFSLF